jgi:hypothetical protein
MTRILVSVYKEIGNQFLYPPVHDAVDSNTDGTKLASRPHQTFEKPPKAATRAVRYIESFLEAGQRGILEICLRDKAS